MDFEKVFASARRAAAKALKAIGPVRVDAEIRVGPDGLSGDADVSTIDTVDQNQLRHGTDKLDDKRAGDRPGTSEGT